MSCSSTWRRRQTGSGCTQTPATLLLDLQARVGALADEVIRATEHGRRPFRPTRDWEVLLGDLAFAMMTLADQTGVDAGRAVQIAADRMYRSAMAQQRAAAGRGVLAVLRRR